MKKWLLRALLTAMYVVFLIPVFVIINTAATISGKSPDILISFMYPPKLKREIKESEKILNKDIAGLCSKLKCRRPFEVKVYAHTFDKEAFAYTLVLHYKKIFISRKLMLSLNREEMKCVLVHEIGHVLLETYNEFEADSFAAETAGKKPCVSMLTKIARLTNNDPSGKSEIAMRIHALKAKKK